MICVDCAKSAIGESSVNCSPVTCYLFSTSESSYFVTRMVTTTVSKEQT